MAPSDRKAAVQEIEEQVGTGAVWIVAGAWWIVPADDSAPVVFPAGPPPLAPPSPN